MPAICPDNRAFRSTQQGRLALLFGYFSAVMCAMMGYAVSQYQGALGYVAVNDEAPSGFPADEYRRRRALADAEVRLKEGRVAMPWELLAKALDVALNHLKLNERCHYLPLVARLNPAQAVTALLNARQLMPDYLPDDAQVCERVAEALLRSHKDPWTQNVQKLLGFIRASYPQFPLLWAVAGLETIIVQLAARA